MIEYQHLLNRRIVVSDNKYVEHPQTLCAFLDVVCLKIVSDRTSLAERLNTIEVTVLAIWSQIPVKVAIPCVIQLSRFGSR